MTSILYIFAAIVMLGVIISVHELGHYIAGRLTGIGIIEFSIGMGPRIIGFTRKGIKYSLRAIPLGGYCKFVGQDDDGDYNNPMAMNNQPVWKRFITIISGALMNFVLAFVVCAIMLANYYVADVMPNIDSVVPDTPAYEVGLHEGDKIVAINGEPLSYDSVGAALMQRTIQESNGETVYLTIVQEGAEGALIEIPITPALVSVEGASAYQIGVTFKSRTYTTAEALGHSATYMYEFTGMMLDSLKNLVFKGEGAGETMGPVGIISFVSEQVREGMYMVLYLMFIISLNLGIMNLLPIPGLDGGRLVFLIVEAIRRKPIPREKEGMVHGIGIMLLFGLIILMTYRDIARIVTGG